MKHLSLRSLTFYAALVIMANSYGHSLGAAVTTISTPAEFDDLLAQGTVVAKFSTKWCGPCKEFEPVFQEVSKNYDATFVTINGDLPAIKPLEKRYGIDGYPTVLLFKKGKKAANLAPIKGVFEMMLDNHCAPKNGKKQAKAAAPMNESESMEIEEEEEMTPPTKPAKAEQAPAKQARPAAKKEAVEKKKEEAPKAPKLHVISTVEEFNQERENNDVLVVKFSADWCGVCTQVDPIIDGLAQVYTDARFIAINCDSKGTASLCKKYKIEFLPTIYFFGKKSGKVDHLVGGKDKFLYEKTIKAMIKTEKEATAPADKASKTAETALVKAAPEKNEAVPGKKK